MNKAIYLFLAIFALAGCKTNDINPLAIPDKFEAVNLEKVEYRVPSAYINQNVGFGGLTFKEFSSGDKTQQGKLLISKIRPGVFEVHRRVDNGTAGSGVIYNVRYDAKEVGEDTLISYAPYEMKAYQQGYILPFPIPEFDVVAFLKESFFVFEFDVNSEFPVDSIQSNIERMIPNKTNYGGKFWHVMEEVKYKAYLNVHVVPYREGSKSQFDIVIVTNANQGNDINLSDFIKEVKHKAEAIVAD